jgi:thioester reductase-like protein
MQSIIDHLEHWARVQPDKLLYSFIDLVGQEQDRYSYQEFHERTIMLAGSLMEHAGVKHGDRVLLVYPPGLEMMAAFFASARLGAIPVPVHAPSPMTFRAGAKKIGLLARDCNARIALSTANYIRSFQQIQGDHGDANGDLDVSWAATDQLAPRGRAWSGNRPNPILFLQYTSGSTGDPKGVIVNHRNVLANCRSADIGCPVSVCWLPQYHDMGLIGNYLFALICGGTVYGFSPLDFLKRPVLWLQTMSRVGATISSAPNFAYEYCLRDDKVPDNALQGIDLSTLRRLTNGAEPVRWETFSRFRDRFAPYGLPPEAHSVAYGLAENTLAVTLQGRQTLVVNKRRLQQGRVRIERGSARNNNQLRIVSCGQPLAGMSVRIVEPTTRRDLRDGDVGEIWITGDSKCEGYWQKPALNRETFAARIRGDDSGDSYLRTGDLGFFHEGELFVCGRLKDLIIVRGVNYYPQDIEAVVEAEFPDVIKGGAGRTACFSVGQAGAERLVVVVEVRDRKEFPDPLAIAAAIRAHHFIEPDTILFVPARSISKTTSGKVARSETCARWLRGELPVLASHDVTRPIKGNASELKDLFARILELYNLDGDEDFSFADIGMDSLTMVEFSLAIQAFFDKHGLSELVDVVDARFLQRLKVAELTALIERFESERELPVPMMRQQLDDIQQRDDATESMRMRRDAEFALPIGVDHNRPRDYDWQPPKNLLLTGATGFFGPFLLASLLRRTTSRIHVLVRAADRCHGSDRVITALKSARMWTNALNDAFTSRVKIVCGDLSRERLGLAPRQWDALAADIDAIMHNGARVNYVLSYDALRAENVGGTRELLQLAFADKSKAFHLISSTFIFGWSVKKLLLEEDHNPDMQRLDFGYAQSKWVAEQLVLRAASLGLPVRVYRPSLISASSGCVGSKDDIAVRLLGFMIRHGLAPTALNQLSFLPADMAAENIMSIFKLGALTENIFHVVADDYYNMSHITRLLSQQHGYPFEYFTLAEFINQMNLLCMPDDPLYPLLLFFNRSYRKMEAMQHKRYDNQSYRRARKKGGERPEPPLAETVAYIVKYMQQEGLIDEPAGKDASLIPQMVPTRDEDFAPASS